MSVWPIPQRFLVFAAMAALALAGLDAGVCQSMSARTASIHGRLWDFVRRPILDGYVFALTADERTVLGCSRTVRPRGPEQGTWRITALPAGQVTLIGFDAEARLGVAVARVTLTAGEDKFFNTLTTQMSTPSLSPGSMPGSDTAGSSWLRLFALVGMMD